MSILSFLERFSICAGDAVSIKRLRSAAVAICLPLNAACANFSASMEMRPVASITARVVNTLLVPMALRTCFVSVLLSVSVNLPSENFVISPASTPERICSAVKVNCFPFASVIPRAEKRSAALSEDVSRLIALRSIKGSTNAAVSARFRLPRSIFCLTVDTCPPVPARLAESCE